MRTFNRLPIALAAVAMALFLMTGCGDNSTPDGDADSHAGHTDDDHEGHDDHAGHGAHMAGPNGGHVVHLGEDEYLAEWLHDDTTDTVTVIIHKHGSEDDYPIGAKEVTIEVATEKTTKTYHLAGMDDKAEKNSRFQKKDYNLLNSLGVEGIEATLTVEIDGKTYKSEIEHHDH